jgi:hypothetical protein
MDQTSTPTEACAYCHVKIAKALKCGGCSSQLGSENHVSTFYCKKECQVADWKVHKKDCKAHQTRQILYRAGYLLQDMFYRYREAMFDRYLVRKETKGDTTFLYEGWYPHVTSQMDMLIPFPHELVTTDEEKKALLAHLACTDAVGWMHDIVKHFLKGWISRQTHCKIITNQLLDIVVEITEIETKTQNRKFQLKTVAINGQIDDEDYPHSIFMVKLKHGGGLYALDLTGAQFGYHQPVVPFVEYSENRAESVWGFESFGSMKQKLLREKSEKSFAGIVHGINAMTYPTMELGAKKWEEYRKIDTMSFLKLPEEKFRTAAKEVLAAFVLTLNIKMGLMREEVARLIAAKAPMTTIINLAYLSELLHGIAEGHCSRKS